MDLAWKVYSLCRNLKRKVPETCVMMYHMSKKKATGTKTAAGSRLMKRNLDMGVEVCDNRVKKNRHTTNEKPNMYLDIFNYNQYFGL